jgi:hypothetical protein
MGGGGAPLSGNLCSVAKWPKFRPNNSKGAVKKFIGRENLMTELFEELARK